MFSSFRELVRWPLEAVGLVQPDCCSLTEKERELVRRLEERMREDVAVFKERCGFVTQLSDNTIELDGRWVYKLEPNDRFAVGEQVSFKVYKTANNVVIKEVRPVEEKRQLVSKRVNTSVKQVENNQVHLCNGLVVDLSQVRSEFLPAQFDHVTLEGEYPADKNESEEFDPDWSAFIVKRIFPTRSKLVVGVVTVFDSNTMKGTIANMVAFHQSVCDKFVPAVGDPVVCNAIEGRYNNALWRAESVSPNNNKQPYNKRHMFTVSHIPRFKVVLGETKVVELTLSNHGRSYVQVLGVHVSSSKNPEEKNLDATQTGMIPPQTSITWPVTVVGSRWGGCSVKLTWKVQIAHRTLEIKSSLFYDVIDPNLASAEATEAAPRMIVPGQRLSGRPIYRKVPLKEYKIPAALIELQEEVHPNKTLSNQIDLLEVCPALGESLNTTNYGEWMHSLLFIEELAEAESYAQLEDQGALFRYRDYICYSFPMDSRHSKVVCGDTIYARKPWETVEYEGRIWEVSPTQIFCRFNTEFENSLRSGAQYHLTFRMNRNTYRRRHQAVDLVLKSIGVDWLFPSVSVDEEPKSPPLCKELSWKNNLLNEQQKHAVQSILSKANFPQPYIIDGPPGTGKTMTIVELILQVYTTEPNCRILVTAPTNSAVDTLGVRLLSHDLIPREDFVRLSSYNAYSQGQIAVQLLDRSFVPNLADQEFEPPQLSDKEPPPALYVKDLGKHRVSIGTLTTLSILNCAGLTPGFFTHVIIDEAGQCLEPDTLMPIALVDPKQTQIVLAGDPMQLGPVVFSQVVKFYKFNRSFLDRLSSTYLYKKKMNVFVNSCGYNPRLITRLIFNYRSLPPIVDLIGSLFYEGDLRPVISDVNSPEAELLRRITLLDRNLHKDSLVFINVNSPEEQIEGSFSWFNNGEILQIFSILNSLYTQGVSPDDIGVITPYALQVKKMYELLDTMQIFSPKIGTVEQYQGQERNVIITSLVRNNSGTMNHLGPFVADPQRVNVSLSRAKVLNIIVGNKATFSRNQLWRSIIEKCILIQSPSNASISQPP